MAFAFGMPVVNVADGLDVGAVVADVLRRLDLSQKQASIYCGYPAGDCSGFSRALAGELPLDLWRLRHLPKEFWKEFIPALASAFIREWFADLLGDFKMARADIKAREERKRA
jgi:hypothetical protein